jgi:hypothetical protein
VKGLRWLLSRGYRAVTRRQLVDRSALGAIAQVDVDVDADVQARTVGAEPRPAL